MSTRWSDPEVELARPPVRPAGRYIGPTTVLIWFALAVVLWLILISFVLTTIAVWRMI